MLRHLSLALAAVLAAKGVPAPAEQRFVPSAEHPTIQSCIDAAVDNDECIVAAGTYNELIDFLGKTVRLRSESGRDVTTIEGTSLDGSVVTCANGEGPATVLEGFTLTGGAGTLINEVLLGGGMYINASGPSIIDCDFEGNVADAGGGLYNDIDSDTSVSGCNFRDNHATIRGGGIYSGLATVTVEDCDFLRNTSDVDAGAIRNYEGNLFVRRCTFAENGAVEVGGAVATLGSFTLIEDCAFDNNSADYGGAVWWEDSSAPPAQPIRRTSFIRNTGYMGGAVAGSNVAINFESCTFEANTASRSGGALVWWGWPPLSFADCHFLRNRAPDGGAMKLDSDSDAHILDSTFRGNVATADGRPGVGGAIAATYGSVPVAVNTVFSGNVAGQGGAIFSPEGAVLVNSSLHGNVATVEGGAVLTWRWIELSNTILWENEAPEGAQLFVTQPYDVHIRHCDIQGSGGSLEWNDLLGADGGGNIDADPEFVRPPHPGDDGEWGTEDDDYGDAHLQADSPCINLGDDAFNEFLEPTGLEVFTDFDGEDRIQSCSVDIGADEAPLLGLDCNDNGTNDACDVLLGLALDCNDNRVPDDCDVLGGARPDCNENGIPDECDLAGTDSDDCNENGLPDECEPLIDCNGNLLRDECETSDGTTRDCNDNLVPDTCEPEAFPPVLYVDDDAPGGGDGVTWQTAFDDLQDALLWSDCALVEEIRIAGGVYKPGTSYTHTFKLGGQSDLIGGFAGISGVDPDARDIVKYETILSGNIGSPASTADDCHNVVTLVKTGGHPVLDGLTITRGNADGPNNYYGGGLYVSFNDVTLRRCLILQNRASYGASGVNFTGPGELFIEDSTFSLNQGSDASFGGGLRIVGSSANANIVGTTFTQSSARYGSAVYMSGPVRVVMGECRFEDNDSGHGTAGAIVAFQGSTLIVRDSVFERNYASTAGAIRIGRATGRIERCRFSSNAATENSAVSYGGAIIVDGTATILHCDFEDNEALSTGGAIAVLSGAAEIRHCNFLRNSANVGGAISNRNDVQPLVADCLLAENSALSGGAIYNEGASSATILRCLLERNTATGQTSTTGRGGAIYNVDESTPLIANSRIVDNTAVYGGGMYSDESSAPLVTDSRIVENTASHGGGIYSDEFSSPTLLRSELLLNRATGAPGTHGLGGGAYAAKDVQMIAWQSTFLRNGAYDGGGVYSTSSLTEIQSCSLLGNTATFRGGGIFSHTTMAPLNDSVFVGNRATYGGGIFNAGVRQQITNCTFAKNDRYAMYSVIGFQSIVNSIFWQNWTGDAYPVSPEAFYVQTGSTATLYYCNVTLRGSIPGGLVRSDGTITEEPLVVRVPDGGADGFGDDLATPDVDESANDDYGDLRLLPTSPGVNEGDPDLAPSEGQTDRDGHPRILCGRVDMGAYETGVGDFDCNGLADLSDFPNWDACMGGPGGAYPSGCESFDFNADLDVDLGDFHALTRLLAPK